MGELDPSAQGKWDDNLSTGMVNGRSIMKACGGAAEMGKGVLDS